MLLAGDVSPNPGPRNNISTKDICPVCIRTIAKNHRRVKCDQCERKLHIKCERISVKIYKNMLKAAEVNRLSYVCTSCLLDELPFDEGYPLEVDDEVEDILETSQ